MLLQVLALIRGDESIIIGAHTGVTEREKGKQDS